MSILSNILNLFKKREDPFNIKIEAISPAHVEQTVKKIIEQISSKSYLTFEEREKEKEMFKECAEKMLESLKALDLSSMTDDEIIENFSCPVNMHWDIMKRKVLDKTVYASSISLNDSFLEFIREKIIHEGLEPLNNLQNEKINNALAALSKERKAELYDENGKLKR